MTAPPPFVDHGAALHACAGGEPPRAHAAALPEARQPVVERTVISL